MRQVLPLTHLVFQGPVGGVSWLKFPFMNWLTLLAHKKSAGLAGYIAYYLEHPRAGISHFMMAACGRCT
jgi:hypothetical protein